MSVRVAVVGCGAMGGHHARAWVDLARHDEDLEVTGLYDLDPEASAELGLELGLPVLDSLERVLGKADAASVAVPTRAHAEVGELLLRGGVDVLMEKPVAPDLEEADRIVEAAGAHRILAVGHTERFNPAVRILLERAENPRFLEVHRLGLFPHRSTDVDAILDLMIHDLDIVLRLVDRPLDSLEAVGVPVLSGRVDIANARLSFEGGCVANITASRVSQKKERKIRLFQKDGYFSVDYVERTVRFIRLEEDTPEGPRILDEELEVSDADPLRAELADFLEAVRTRRPPAVPGWEGRRALEAAMAVRRSIGEALSREGLPVPEELP